MMISSEMWEVMWQLVGAPEAQRVQSESHVCDHRSIFPTIGCKMTYVVWIFWDSEQISDNNWRMAQI